MMSFFFYKHQTYANLRNNYPFLAESNNSKLQAFEGWGSKKSPTQQGALNPYRGNQTITTCVVILSDLPIMYCLGWC